MMGSIADHLWQSTLFTAAAALLTLAFRRNRAHVRYWIWLAASVKFLVPFAALMAIGSQFGWRPAVPILQMERTLVIQVMGQPFTQPGFAPVVASDATPSAVAAVLPGALLAIWFGGMAVALLAWTIRWRRVATITREASPIEGGRLVETLRRLEKIAGLRRPTAVVAADTSVEPGVFGIVRPVLLWPRSIDERLGDREVEAILAHEVCHVLRRDNLAAALHMAVQTAFWFYPLVWWIGARLVDERERACDEAVLQLGSEPQVYAETILKTCEFYVESPPSCVAGVSGSDLKKRIEQIMRHDACVVLSPRRKFLLVTAAAATLAGPIAVGAWNAPPRQPSGASATTFAVASVRLNQSGGPMMRGIGLEPGGRFEATNASLRELVRAGYRLQKFQISGGPDWIDSDRFDIVATANGTSKPDEWQMMLRSLLAERFKLAFHEETQELPVYALVVAASDGTLGPYLKRSDVDCTAMRAERRLDRRNTTPCSLFLEGGRDARLRASATPVSDVASVLSSVVNRVIIDRTGLTGGFNVDVAWTPESWIPGTLLSPDAPPGGVSLFTAIEQQLGLRLEPDRAPVDVVVIDSAERPGPD